MTDYLVCLVIPAGRKKYLEVLIPQLLQQEGWHELQIWENTLNADDLQFINKIATVLEKFDFKPLETPIVEFADTLLGKYGEEEKLIYSYIGFYFLY